MTVNKPRTCTIHQPHFFPWLGYFNKLANTDVFVVLDDVQYRDRYFQNRTILSNVNGPYWFTVPVHHDRGKLIKDVSVVEGYPWPKKLLTHLRHNYGKCAFFGETHAFLAKTLSECNSNGLAEQNKSSLLAVCDLLGIDFEVRISSDYNIKGSPHEKLARICSRVQAGEIIFGEGNGLQYHGEAVFRQSSVRIVRQDFFESLNSFNESEGFDGANYSVLHYLCHFGAKTTSKLVKDLWHRADGNFL